MTNGMILKRIMYVDDDPDLQNLVRLGLETRGGFTVKICDSGKQAIEEIKDFQPDLVILDVVMPGMSGPKTLEALQNIPGIPPVPTIFLTSKTRRQEMDLYKRLGAIGVIDKPLNPMKLAEQLKEIWERSSGS